MPAPHVIPWLSPRASMPVQPVLMCPTMWQPLPAESMKRRWISSGNGILFLLCAAVSASIPANSNADAGSLTSLWPSGHLKRFASDWYFENIGLAKEPFPVTKRQKVAVVGAGPCRSDLRLFSGKNGLQGDCF